jgi:alpha-D-xyloside xylohydrolase
LATAVVAGRSSRSFSRHSAEVGVDGQADVSSAPTPLLPAIVAVPGGSGLRWRGPYDSGLVTSYGIESIRVKLTPLGHFRDDLPGAILEHPELQGKPASAVTVWVSADGSAANLTVGDARVTLAVWGECCSSDRQIKMSYYRVSTGQRVLQEHYPLHGHPARLFRPIARGSKLFSAHVSFEAQEGEQLFGLGQHQHGQLDQKGLTIDMRQFNTEVSIPFLLSSLGYGLAWNMPGEGRVELGQAGRTRWVADAAEQVDYVFMLGASSLFDVTARLVEASGHSPALPDFALGYIQCKLRYASQAEVLNVTREFRARGIPLAMVVVDYLHWPHQGDWRFDPKVRRTVPASHPGERESRVRPDSVLACPMLRARACSAPRLTKWERTRLSALDSRALLRTAHCLTVPPRRSTGRTCPQ